MPTGTTFITWGEVHAYTVVPKLTQYYIAMRRSECASAVCCALQPETENLRGILTLVLVTKYKIERNRIRCVNRTECPIH